MTSFICPSCKRVQKPPGAFAGSRFTCPGCGKELLIPAAARQQVVAEEPRSESLPTMSPDEWGRLDGALATTTSSNPSAAPNLVPLPTAPDLRRRAELPPGIPRGISADLLARLGGPLAVHATPNSGSTWRLVLGGVLLAAALLSIVGGTGLIPLGMGLVGVLLLSRGFTRAQAESVVLCRDGLIYQGKDTCWFHWNAVQAVAHSFSARDNSVRSFVIHLRNGERLALPQTLSEHPVLVRQVDEILTRRWLPEVAAKMRGGETFRFGPFAVDIHCLALPDRRVDWPAVAEAYVKNDQVIVAIKQGASAALWAQVPIDQVQNAGLLVVIVNKLVESHSPA